MEPSYDSTVSAGYRDVVLNMRITSKRAVHLRVDTHVCAPLARSVWMALSVCLSLSLCASLSLSLSRSLARSLVFAVRLRLQFLRFSLFLCLSLCLFSLFSLPLPPSALVSVRLPLLTDSNTCYGGGHRCVSCSSCCVISPR
eukprot:1137472-Rhodomonas_salina.1